MREFDARTGSAHEGAVLADLRALRSRSADDAALMREIEATIPAFPLKVQIQTHTRCNAACEMCPYPEITGEPGWTHQTMSLELYETILSQLVGHGVQRLSLFLMNEPLLDRRMPALLSRAREVLPTTTLGLFTNGSVLTGRLALALAEAGLDELCVSVHGFDAETYESTMRGLSFARLRRNLGEVFEALDTGRLGAMTLLLVAGDLPELRASLDRAEPMWRERVLLKAFSNERAVSDVRKGLDSSPATPGAPLCQRPFVKLYVLSDGEVVLCNADWRKKVVLGRIRADGTGPTLQEIWQGARFREIRLAWIRRRFAAGHPCAGCDYPEVIDLG